MKKSSYQQPEVPEVGGDYAEHLNDGCEQDDVLQVPETRTQQHTGENWSLVHTEAAQHQGCRFSSLAVVYLTRGKT